MPRTSCWTTIPSPLTSNACAENSSRSTRLLMRSRPCTEWAIAGSSEHSPAIVDRRAHHAGTAVGGLSICARTRDCAARLAGKVAACERRHHRQCLVGSAATRVSRSRRHSSVRRGPRGLVRLSSAQPTALGRLSRRLGRGGESHTLAHRHGLSGARLWVEAEDGRGNGKSGVDAVGVPDGGRLFFTTAGLADLLSTFVRDGTRATVIDANALKLGVAGTLSANIPGASEEDTESWYRRLMSVDTSNFPLQSSSLDRLGGNSVAAALAVEAHAEWVRSAASPDLLLTAAAPILSDGQTRGAVYLAQAGDQLLALRDRAVTRLFNLTLLATAAAVIIMFGFATWISLRIGRLRNAADSAVG